MAEIKYEILGQHIWLQLTVVRSDCHPVKDTTRIGWINMSQVPAIVEMHKLGWPDDPATYLYGLGLYVLESRRDIIEAQRKATTEMKGRLV